MKLNKRKCRKFADLGFKFPANHGMLHASQIKYIVCTAIKIIDHHRTLILYVYPRKQLAKGNFQPCYTVFQTKDDYITLARKEDGSTTWRKSAFDDLDKSYWFSNSCAFYSAKDESCVSRYFKADTDSGFKPLVKAQDAILARRRKQRQIAKEQAIAARMAGITALPCWLESWVKSIMPAYFFYDYKRGAKTVSGVCSACGHAATLPGIKQSNKAICPHCRHELTAKPRSRRGACMYNRSTCQVIQNTGDGIVIRMIKVYYSYHGDTPEIEIYENARHFLQPNTNGEICTESFYYSYNDCILTNWKKGFRPVFSQWQYNFESDMNGHLYTKNLPDALRDTPWHYCPIDIFYNHSRVPIEIFPFLSAYLRHPRLEHLVKVGFYSITSDIVYKYRADALDETQNRTHRILQVAAEDIPFLKKLDVNISTLQIYQKYSGRKDRQELLLWQLEHKIERDTLPILRYITAHKMIRYLDKQYSFLYLRQTPYGIIRYNSMQDLVSEYQDYLEICQKIGYDLKNSFILYPKDLQKSHDSVSRRLKHKTEAKIKRDFITVYKRIAGQFDFEKDGMKIVCPTTPENLVEESHSLRHCVEKYTDRVANHECIILFLRQCPDLSKPYYTIEVQGNKAVQVRGFGNCAATTEVQQFITAWQQRVLDKLEPAA